MRIAITGASGTLGTALVERLVATDAATEVMGVSRRLPAGTTPAGAGQGRLRWTTADLTDPSCRPRLEAAFCEVDAVVHLAWGHRLSDRTAHLERLGVGGTALVMAAATRQRVPHVVHLSSAAVYSPKTDDRPVDETHRADGITGSAYSRHKVAAERLLDTWPSTSRARDAAGAGHVPAVTLMRPGLVGHLPASVGTSRHPGGLPWLGLVPLDRLLVLPVVHADDVADAVVRALTRRAVGPFNLSAPRPATPTLVASALGARTVHLPAGLVRTVAATTRWGGWQPVDPGWIDLAMQVPLLDTHRAAEELGWRPRYDAEAVLASLVDAVRPPHHPGTRTA